MTILDNIKTFLVGRSAAQSEDILFNHDDFTDENRIVLSVKDGGFCDVGLKSVLTADVKNFSMETALTLADTLYNLLCPPKNYSKPFMLINDIVLTKTLKPPVYKEKEKNGRYVVSFELLVISPRV